MKYDFSSIQFLNSITGISAITASSMFVARKYNLAAFVFGALALGSMGVAWDRYSTKSGSALDVRVIKKGRKPDQDEIKFIMTHLPYAVLAIISFLATKASKKI